jgi:hypothetical protein
MSLKNGSIKEAMINKDKNKKVLIQKLKEELEKTLKSSNR